MGSSQTRARTCVPYIGRRILNHCTTREAPRLIISAFKARSLASTPALRVLLNLELVLNLTQKARSKSLPHAKGIQSREGRHVRDRKRSRTKQVVQKRGRKRSGTLTWSQLNMAYSNRLSHSSVPASRTAGETGSSYLWVMCFQQGPGPTLLSVQGIQISVTACILSGDESGCLSK